VCVCARACVGACEMDGTTNDAPTGKNEGRANRVLAAERRARACVLRERECVCVSRCVSQNHTKVLHRRQMPVVWDASMACEFVGAQSMSSPIRDASDT